MSEPLGASIDWTALPGPESEQAAHDERRVRKGFWRKIKGGATHIPFAGEALTAYFAAFDRDTPLRVRASLLGALAYFVLPLDGIPDIIPLIGLGDDAAMLFGAMKLISSHIKPHHRAAAEETLRAAREDARAEEQMAGEAGT
ncbi:YkvA family protein [Xanthobacteraceae bacterium A53D]